MQADGLAGFQIQHRGTRISTKGCVVAQNHHPIGTITGDHPWREALYVVYSIEQLLHQLRIIPATVPGRVAHGRDRITRFQLAVGKIQARNIVSGLYTKKSDVYSYGMVLYELAVKEPPFKGMNPLQVVRAIDENEMPELPSELDEEFRELVEGKAVPWEILILS